MLGVRKDKTDRGSASTPVAVAHAEISNGLLDTPGRFCFFPGQPTAQITDLPIPLCLSQHLANILGIHNQRITVPHRPHVVDQPPSSIWAYAEQFSDLAPVDVPCGYLAQSGAN